MSQVLSLFERSVGDHEELGGALPAPPKEESLAGAPDSFSLSEIPTAQAELHPSCCAIFHTDPLAAASDRFRLLRMRLRDHNKAGRLKTLLITSPLPHDGKSTIAVNLATALSEDSKYKVLVVEADLHRPCLTRQLGLAGWRGLSEYLQGDLPAVETIRRIEPLGWFLMPAGEPPRNPTELVQTSEFHTLKQQLFDHFDWVLIDSPPIIPLTDALSLRPHSDATLLVVRAGQTPADTIDRSIALLGKQHIAGIVFNGVPGLERAYSKYGYYRSKT